MQESYQTRASLLLRIRDAQDTQAWGEFVEIYESLIYRVARQQGVQHADALELTQEVLLTVARSINRWDAEPSRGSFRGWLRRVARNLTINYLIRQRRHPQGVGDTDFQSLLAEQPDPHSEESASFDLECRRSLFLRAAQQIQDEFQASTWLAFWNSCVLQQSVKEVAAELEMTPGAIYVARSRVMARLRKCVQEYVERDL